MKSILTYLLIGIIFTALCSCATQPNIKYSTIEYEAGACFGFCPIFTMTIQSDRSAIIEAEHFTFTPGQSRGEISQTREGTFKATIHERDYQRLTQLLDKINIYSLEDNYGNRNVSDLPTAYVRVTDESGNRKEIEDYGKNGTPQLGELYTFFENMRFSQTWIKEKNASQ